MKPLLPVAGALGTYGYLRLVASLTVARRYVRDDDADADSDLDAYSYQFGEEARAIQRGEPTVVPVSEGTWTLRIMETIRASATDPNDLQTVPLSTDGT